MKKRLCSILLIFALLLPTVGSMVTPAAAASIPVTTGNAQSVEQMDDPSPYAKYATDSGAFLKGLEFDQSGPWNLQIRATDVTAGGQTYVVILRYDLFNTNYNSDGAIGGINPGTYTTLAPGTSNSNYYRTENHTATNGTALTIFDQKLYEFPKDNAFKIGESSTTYHMRYAAIIFDGGTTVENLSDYTIVSFYMDSSGMLQTTSYMLRYLKNKYPNPSGSTDANAMASNYQIEPWGEGAAINTDVKPSRRGYTFKGWDANGRILNSDANKAAQMLGPDGTTVVAPTYAAGTAGTVDWSTVSQKFGTTEFNKTSDKFYDLYAIWQPNKVEFSETNADTKTPATAKITYGGSEMDIPMLNLPSPQVGVTYSQTGNLESPTTDGGTDKSYVYLSATVNLEDGTSVPTVDPSKDASASDPQKKYNLTTAQNTKTSWKITGKPDGHSNGKPVYVLLQVTDNDNQTTDMILLRFAEIKKGAQLLPDEDVNTGLEGTSQTLDGTKTETSLPKAVEDALIAELQAEKDKETGGTEPSPTTTDSPGTEGQAKGENESDESKDPPVSTTKVTRDDLYSGGFVDGSLIGMYSAGQPSKTDSNGSAMTDRTGTYTDYWLRLGAIYEYRPYRISGETVSYADVETGWREVPFRKDKYKAADLTKVESAMGYKSTTAANTKTVASGNNNHGTVASVITSPIPAWNATYGWIQWNGNLPEVHGLKVGDQYEVRFKENDNYSHSDGSVIITIGGGGGGGAAEAKPDDFAAIVFYDWDETYLGATVVAKNADAKAFQNAIAKFVSTVYSGYKDGMSFPAALTDESWVDNDKLPLTYKKGYNFAGWVQVNGENTPTLTEAFTAYAELGETGEDGSYPEGTFNAEKFSPTAAPSGGWGNITLKAAYVENAHCNEGDGGNNYTVRQIEYNRYGNATASGGNYSIKLQIQRWNRGNAGVTRLRKPALRVLMTPDLPNATAFYSIYYLDAFDETEVEIVPAKSIRVAEYTVIDAYGVSNWTGAGAKLNNIVGKTELTQSKNTDGVQGTAGFIREGSITFINEQGQLQNLGQASNWGTFVNAVTLQDAGLTYNGKRIASNTTANTVKPFILKALKDNNNEPLSFTQLQHAIDHNGELLSINESTN